MPLSASNTVPVLTEPQLGPHYPMSGSSIIPVVPRTQVEGEENILPNPGYGGRASSAAQYNAGGSAAPSLPGNGFLFTPGPIDSHYTSEAESYNPYKRVNSPPTRGMFTRMQDFINGIATSQDTDNAGWKERHPQQRTSHMRNTLPPHGGGYAPETYTPRQMPQAPRWNRIQPATGTQAYGTGVLNSDQFGAGQTAGGIGGSNYTPSPGPPSTTSTAGTSSDGSGMPVWG